MEDVVAELSHMIDGRSAAPLPVERELLEQWELHTNIGRILFRHLTNTAEDYARAKEHFVAAKKFAAAIDGEESGMFASSLHNLAQVLSDQVRSFVVCS